MCVKALLWHNRITQTFCTGASRRNPEVLHKARLRAPIYAPLFRPAQIFSRQCQTFPRTRQNCMHTEIRCNRISARTDRPEYYSDHLSDILPRRLPQR